jgi:hypothetical protein
MKSTDLRIGNLIEYHVFDELDNPQSQWVENLVDLDDLEAIDGSENYRPMEITKDILNRFGFEADGPGWYWLNEENRLTTVGFAYGMDNNIFEFEGLEITMQYVHQLQNLYFALTGKELENKF